MGEVTTATIATTPTNTNPTTFRSISGFPSAIRDSQQPTSPIGFLFWNFRHRLARYYLQWVLCSRVIFLKYATIVVISYKILTHCYSHHIHKQNYPIHQSICSAFLHSTDVDLDHHDHLSSSGHMCGFGIWIHGHHTCTNLGWESTWGTKGWFLGHLDGETTHQ